MPTSNGAFMRRQSPRPRYGWTIVASLVATSLFIAALRNDFYQLTSPFELSWHVALRKIYSVGAFALVTFLARQAAVERGFRPNALATVASGAIFSAAIEIGQFLLGSGEGLLWNAFDIACGALGGSIALIALAFPARPKRAPSVRPQARLRRPRTDLRE